ncbi:MAG: class I SAM-dependent methyltransferase [Thermotogota bacterium]|nr:class I SAM-dependent methyltransferase [Thermotogota bacterium]
MKKELFDKWSNQYDQSVIGKGFPFSGYEKALDNLIKSIRITHSTQVLEMGVGTGFLLSKFYQNGAQCYGFDFSDKMLGIAEEKMPSAFLFQQDLKTGISEKIKRARFSIILAGYVLHHFNLQEKIEIIRQYLSLLKKEDGRMYIFDVSFKRKEDHDLYKKKHLELWDDEESYFIAEEIKDHFENCEYKQFSPCGGLYTIS